MRYLKIAFGLVMVAGLMAVVASPAMATPRWVHCVKSETGKYSNGLCNAAGSGWETKELVGTSEVTSSGELELEDQKSPDEGTSVKCTGRNTGWVANLASTSEPGEGGISTVISTGCVFVHAGACETGTTPTAEPRNLPWGLKLEERGSEVRAKIVSGNSAGAPGWAVKCKAIVNITDTCEVTGNTVNVVANRTTGKTEFVFDARTKEEPMAKCSIGGAEAGLVKGTILSQLRSGNALWVLAPNLKT
jgi:hypothetical protein